MPVINMDSISAKCKSWSETAEGKRRMRTAIASNSIGLTGCGDVVVNDAFASQVASVMCKILSNALRGSGLNIDVEADAPVETISGGYIVDINFYGVERESLVPSLYGGLDNIVAAFNKGYHAKNYVYGRWLSKDSDGVGSFSFVRSKKDRDGLHFIERAIQEFNREYGDRYNIAVTVGDEYL